MSRCLPIVLLCALASACDDEPLAEAPRPALDAAVDAPAHDAAPDAAAPDAGPKLRSVQRRNPFGNTAIVNNLMIDGDFEWTSGSGQYGWRALNVSGEVTLTRETGGLCRSGVMCGVLERDFSLIGMAAAPRGRDMLVTLYSKPPDPNCALTRVTMISCTTNVLFNLATVPVVSELPAADGWCQHRAIVPAMDQQPCLYVSSYAQTGRRTLIDDASIVAADGTGASPLAASPPSAELQERVARDVRWLNEHQRLGRFHTSDP